MKYLMHNDLSYLLHKRRIMLIVIFTLPILILILNIKGSSMVEIIKLCMGMNLSLSNIDITQLLMYLFNVFGFIYLMVDIYLKDLDKNLENIFLRMSPNKYIIQKNIFFVTAMIIVKTIQYFIMILLFIIIGRQSFSIEIIFLVLTDLTYILLIQYLFFMIYIFYILFRKNTVFLLAAIIILMVVIPKFIWGTKPYIMNIITITILVQMIMNAMFYKYPKRIMENV